MSALGKNRFSFASVCCVCGFGDLYAFDGESHVPNLTTQQQTIVFAHLINR